jgi:hypothetical protein
MNKKEVIKFIEAEINDTCDYNFLVLDMRKKKPSIFRSWRV